MKQRLLNIALIGAFVVACADDSGITMTDPRFSAIGETITVLRGDNQVGAGGQALRINPRFVVRDALDNPVAAARGTIVVTAGGGSVSKGTFKTKANGQAVFVWTLGTSGPQTVTVTLNGGGASATFNATVIPAGSELIITLGNNQIARPGDTVSTDVRVRLVDNLGNGIPGIVGMPIQWYAADGAGGVRTANGTLNSDGRATNRWALGWASTGQTLVAKVAGVDSVIFNATANTTGYTLSVLSGNNQSANASSPLTNPIVVRVTNHLGAFVQGAKGSFEVTSGGGTVAGANAVPFTTNINGRGTTTWTLGAAGAQEVTATVGALGSVTFDATINVPLSNFDFDIVYITAPTAGQQAAIESAIARWREVITGDLADQNIVNLTVSASCVASQPVVNQIIDDVKIFVDFAPIDGVGGILGSAGPCYVRGSNFLTSIGVMKFDAADVADMESDGSLEDVILHEMGHVLGIGTLWANAHGALPARLTAVGFDSVYFAGPAAQAAFTASGGGSFVGPIVPVENCVGIPGCGAGTINGHWRELVMGHELMTGYLSGAVRALSLITVQSLADIGYTVSTAAADPYTVSPSLRAPGPEPAVRELKEGPPPPIFTLDPITGAPRRIR